MNTKTGRSRRERPVFYVLLYRYFTATLQLAFLLTLSLRSTPANHQHE